jgi:small subunit ribosomal protein S20
VANHKSAVKAHKQNVTRRAHNRDQRSRARRALRAVRAAIDGGDSSAAKETLRTTVPLLDKLVSKGVIHANAAARYKSRLTRRLQKLSAAA